jgi:hypothetical protein
MSTAFSFGVHTIISPVTSTTVTFQIYNPYTPIPNTELDESFPITGTPYGIAVKILAYEEEDTVSIVPEAYYASFELEFTTTGILYLDLLQMATFDVPEYHQPRAIEIFLNPNKTNFLLNPGFNPSTLSDTWDVTASEPETTFARTGGSGLLLGKLPDESPALVGSGFVLLVEEDSNSDAIVETISAPINTGKFVTASVYLKAYGTTTGDLTLSLEAIDSADDSSLGLTSEVPITLTSSWQRYSTTLFIPTDSRDTIVVNMSLVSDGNIKFFLDRAQVEESFRPTDYFSGSDTLGEASADGAFWEGNRYESPSHLYANFGQKIDRLVQQLPNYVPVNLSFLVRWHGGGVAKPFI